MAFLPHIHTVPCHLEQDMITTKDLDSQLNICQLLLHPTYRRAIRRAKEELSAQLPMCWQTLLSVDFLCEALLVMLQVATEAFGAECSSG